MSKNVIIGLVVVAVIGVYFFVKSKKQAPATAPEAEAKTGRRHFSQRNLYFARTGQAQITQDIINAANLRAW